ncbi:MAG TPA: D-hexose-6-phosphate mutarotase [Holophaga sp.]|nr:D-hexose-6-phosphate mutarotase [Holophaga sp.]
MMHAPRLATGPEGQLKLILMDPSGAKAEVFLHGAHVTSWMPADGRERLFLSQKAAFGPGASIRGGVPVIFPQFAALGPMIKHGFTRSLPWEPLESPEGQARLRLCQSEATLSHWPFDFEAILNVALGQDRLSVSLSVLNTSSEAFHFTAALHTYLRVSDIANVSVKGLQGLRLRDSAQGVPQESIERIEEASEVRFDGEVDRIYFETGNPVTVHEDAHATEIQATGFSDTVVWNPGAALAAKLPDMEADGHRHMVCVESAAIGHPIHLQPGSRWSGTQTLIARH